MIRLQNDVELFIEEGERIILDEGDVGCDVLQLHAALQLILHLDPPDAGSDLLLEEATEEVGTLVGLLSDGSPILGEEEAGGVLSVADGEEICSILPPPLILCQKRIERLAIGAGDHRHVVNEKSLSQVKAKLANEQFMANAKQEAIEKEEGKRVEFEEKIEKGRKHLALLESFI